MPAQTALEPPAIVVDGVVEPAQVLRLMAIRVEHFQTYLFARPDEDIEGALARVKEQWQRW